MKRSLIGAALSFAVACPAAFAADALTVCLNKDNEPFSLKKDGKEQGFDVAIAGAVARQLGRPLEIKWYQKERRSRGPVSVKTSVLVESGVCDLVGGFPLVQSSLERPGAGEEATLPPVEGMADDMRSKKIKGAPLMPSRAYHFAGMTPVLGPAVSGKITSLDDLKPYRMAHRPASIGDLIAMAYKGGALAGKTSHVNPDVDPLDAVARGEADVTLTEMHHFDMYKVQNPQTTLRASGLLVPVGFNLGFVTTERHADLLASVNKALDTLVSSGEADKIASDAKLTWTAPQAPDVRTGLGLEQFAK